MMPPIIRVLRLSRYAKRVRVDGCACPSTARGRREPGGTWCATTGCVRTTRMSHHLPSYGRPAVMAGQRAVRPGISRDRPWYEAPPNEQARDGRRRIDPPLEPGRFTRRQGGEIGETRTDSAGFVGGDIEGSRLPDQIASVPGLPQLHRDACFPP